MTAQSEKAHTPTPWEVNLDGVFKGGHCFVVCDTDRFSTKTNIANAAHIVKCVNAHDALVEALCNLRAVVRQDTTKIRGLIGNMKSDFLFAIDTALKLAGE